MPIRVIALVLCVALLGAAGCAVVFPGKAEPPPAPAPGTPPAAPPAGAPAPVETGQVILTPSASPLAVEWGTPAEIEVRVAWAEPKAQAVQITPAAQTPRWLSVAVEPAIVEPPATVKLRLSVVPGMAVPGPLTLVLETASHNLPEPERTELRVSIQRRAGEFQSIEAGPLTHECRNICGQFRDSVLAFYDVLKEQGQSCTDTQPFPDNQRLGARVFETTSKGFGFGRTCAVAAVFERSGTLSFLNLGLSPALPRGAVLLSLRGARDVWLSPDNTVALVHLSDMLVPYDVATGRQLAAPCRITADPPPAILRADTITAGPCQWQIR